MNLRFWRKQSFAFFFLFALILNSKAQQITGAKEVLLEVIDSSKMIKKSGRLISNFKTKGDSIQKFKQEVNEILKKKNDLDLKQNNALKNLRDKSSIKNNDLISKIDALQKLKNIQNIPSEQALMKLYDSLVKKGMPPIPQQPDEKKEPVTREQLLDQVNNEFNKTTAETKDSLTQLSSEVKDEANGYKKTLSQISLQSPDKADLLPLSGGLVNNKITSRLDSLRKVDLKTEKLRLSEKSISEKDKAILLEPREGFWQKSYWEGIVGFTGDGFQNVQLSPAFGYHFAKGFSIGVGPSVQIQQKDAQKIQIVGAGRIFSKLEFFNSQAYLQVEDNVSEEKRPEISNHLHHKILGGAGYVLPVSPVSVNIVVLYQLNERVSKESSPWVVRIGLSSIKNKNKSKR